MRLALAACALFLSYLVLAAQPATPQAAAPDATAPPVNQAAVGAHIAAAPAATTPSAQVANDAAARHAKRTSCLKEARAHKLVGADKTAFIKVCIDAPPDAVSANRISPPDRP